MIYVMSDIHGQYEKYLKMLKKINFSDDDVLYISGDVVDRGDGGIKILRHMMDRFNIVPLLGNHEYMAYSVLKRLNVEITNDSIEGVDENVMQSVNEWLINGGAPTMKAFSALSKDEKADVLDYIVEMELFCEVEADGKSFVLVHADLENFSPERDLGDYELFEMIFSRADYDRVYFKDRYLVTGHTPTALIDKASGGKIFKINNHICIDCGASMGGELGCLCLDTMEEFYV